MGFTCPLTCTLLQIFSIVLPNTLLFISLKRSFSFCTKKRQGKSYEVNSKANELHLQQEKLLVAIQVILHGKGEVTHHVMAVLLQYLRTDEKSFMKKSLV